MNLFGPKDHPNTHDFHQQLSSDDSLDNISIEKEEIKEIKRIDNKD